MSDNAAQMTNMPTAAVSSPLFFEALRSLPQRSFICNFIYSNILPFSVQTHEISVEIETAFFA